MLIRCLLVAAGGAAGSVARYLIGLWAGAHYSGRFPAGTFFINVSGSFLIGLLLTSFERHELSHPDLRPFFITGLLGGYTTFSAFEWEAFALARGAPSAAALYAFGSVAAGFAACYAGALLGRRG